MMKSGPKTSGSCPCGRGQSYAACCQPLHTGAAAPDAETLMRARYTAYVMRLDAYLLATWHPSTRPIELDTAVSPPPIFFRLEVKRHTQIDDASASVDFVAHYKVGGRAQRMHEISRFVFENGSWLYLSGEVSEG